MWRTQCLLMLQWPAFVHRGGGHCLGCAEQDRIGAGFCSWAGRCPACSHADGVIKISVAVCFTPAPQKLSKLFSALRRILGAFRWFPEGKRAQVAAQQWNGYCTSFVLRASLMTPLLIHHRDFNRHVLGYTWMFCFSVVSSISMPLHKDIFGANTSFQQSQQY